MTPDDGLCAATASCLWVSDGGEGKVLVAGRFGMGSFHSLPVVGFEMTENDQEKSPGGRQLKPSLCVCSPPSKLLKQDAKSCLMPTPPLLSPFLCIPRVVSVA